MTREQVDIPMEQEEPDGEVEKYTIQTGSRVKIPDNWLEFLDLEVGDDVIVACEEDGIRIMEWSRENISKL